MTTMAVTRVDWRERQRVLARDMLAEQAYRLQAAGRHHIAPHDWGVVRGLWLVRGDDGGESWRVTEGVAVDGYGRELLVREPIEFQLPDDDPRQAAFRVLLYYCESPASLQPCAPCREDPAPRTVQHVQLVVSPTRSAVTGDAAGLDVARAAGRLPDMPVWPVLLGEITLGERKLDETRYHRQRASLLRSPSGAVTLRHGLLGPDDRYHMLLTTAASTSTPVKRLGIDRDGTAHVWKRLVVTGAVGSALVPLSAHTALRVSTIMPAGELRRVSITGVVENAVDPRITVRWRDNTGMRDVAHADLLVKTKAFLDNEFRFAGLHDVRLRLVDASRPTRRVQVRRRMADQPEPALVLESFTAVIAPSGGRLVVATRRTTDGAPVIVPCDEARRVVARNASTPTAGGVVYFRPAAQAVPAPTARSVQAVAAPLPDGTPLTVLQLSGGELDDGDHGARVTIGTRDGASGWEAILSVNGTGGVAIPRKDTTLVVNHTLRLPPITTNPADPLTQDLLALAYNAGLRRAGRIADAAIGISFTFANTPETVHRGADFSYTLHLANGNAGAITIKRVLELVVGTPKPPATDEDRAVALRTLPMTTTGSQDLSVVIPAFQHPAGHVVIAVDVLFTVGGKDYVSAAVSSLIDVTN